MLKIYKLFKIEIFRIETFDNVSEEPKKKKLFGKVAGDILDVSPEELQKEIEGK